MFDKFRKSRTQGTSQRTVESYHYTLNGFIGYPLTTEGIARYLNTLSCHNGKLKFYSCLRALFGWLYQNGCIASNPIKCVCSPKTQKKLLPAISKKQLDSLPVYYHCERAKALISFLWHSGTRISEAVSMRAKDFDWNEGTVIVLGKGNRYRKALAGNGIVKQWFSQHNSFQIAKGGAQTVLKRLKAERGIQCNAHSFRHLIGDEGISIMVAL